jgi:1-deoxy-D-xylulose-5-phosphate synthase
MSDGLLAQIHDPRDLAVLSYEQLEELSSEIRAYLVDQISNTGGHLSPNLGVVELTLAIHRSFDSPRDRIIFDVGHQAYVHKLITGRQDFSELRQFGGLSGYPNRQESEHDWVENSHASTALSYALGNALAVARRGEDAYTVAVIGDGALTGGMAYEALNHIAVVQPPRLIIVLNDNGRSYAPTVGGIAALAHMRFDPRYEWAKKALGKMLRGIPGVGEGADELARRLKEGLKQLIEPGTVFDAMGLKYSGVIDGHDIKALEEAFAHARAFDEPTVVHVITEKGKGYEPAIRDEVDKLHGVGSFHVPTGQPKNSELKLTDIAGRALVHAAREHPELIGISAAMISSTGLAEMAEELPDRVIDTGIAEQHAVALAAGLAMAGLRPVVAIYSSFLQRAFDQVTMDVALHDLPVVFLIDRAGITGPDGASHHGAFDLSYLRMIPNMTIGAPSDATELCAMIGTAVTTDGPIAIRFPKGAAGSLPGLPIEPMEVGVWEELRQGTDAVIFAVGRMVESAVKSAIALEQRGLSIGVVNARWVKPMDPRIHEWAAGVPHVITIEDNVLSGGFGEGVMDLLSDGSSKVHTIGLPDRFLPFGSAAAVLESVGMDVESLVDRIATALG